jgi:predicted AlkP superfamily phosphohydrolase/phosphomutase
MDRKDYKMSKKILIIGLDDVSWNVLNPMIESGYMHYLKNEIEERRAGVICSIREQKDYSQNWNQ